MLFFDDFETDRGRIGNASGSDTVPTGIWERRDPGDPEYGGEVMQLGTAVGGTQDLVIG